MLTDKTIKSALRDVVTETTLNDDQPQGGGTLVLVVRRLKNGDTSATWFARWKRDGKLKKKTLGRYPDMPLVEARAKFTNDISPLLRAGRNISVVPVAGGKPTVERMFQAYADHMKAAGKASATEVERQLLKAKDNAADALGSNRMAGDIEPGDVADLVAKFFKRGSRGAADKVRAYVSAAYNWAIKSTNDYTVENRQDWGVKLNPAAAVAKDHKATTARDRNLDADELRALWHAAAPGLNGFTLETAACVRLLIGTGQRVTAALRMEGSELDLDAAVWEMPAHKTKTHRPHAIPLPSQVMPLLRLLVGKYGDGPLFPGRSDSKDRYMEHRSIAQALDRWRALDGVVIEAFQTRDIRRTWKSRTGEIGITREVRDLIQMHARNDTGSKHYDRADYLPMMRAAMDLWETWLENNVVKIQQLDKAA